MIIDCGGSSGRPVENVRKQEVVSKSRPLKNSVYKVRVVFVFVFYVVGGRRLKKKKVT